MEATKAALESERKIQQLQMQAINALWKKVSTLQAAGKSLETILYIVILNQRLVWKKYNFFAVNLVS